MADTTDTAQRLRTESRDSLTRSIQTATEAREIGASTIIKLNEQGEQIQRNLHSMDVIDESLSRAQRLVRGMKSTVGAMKNVFTQERAQKTERDRMDGTLIGRPRSTQQSLASSTSPVSVVETEDEQLNVLGGLLDDLNHQARDMNGLLRQQDIYVSELGARIDSTSVNLRTSTRDMRKIT